ncbi:cytochrome P450 [Xylariaceae sp. FL0255]|nr:cytochrome P450 [Xylariaceae sp. FL0255]
MAMEWRVSAILPLALGILLVAYFVVVIPVYNVYFHPLRKYPGPKLWAASIVPWLRTFISGEMPTKSLEMHNKYGPIVRTGPNELSFNTAEYWDAVMGHRKAGQSENMKAAYYVSHDPNALIFAPRDDHSRQRRMLSRGFSTASMLEKQPIIRGYVDKLIKQLHERIQKGETKFNMGMWYNCTTFDIMGDLTFNESFGCLEAGALHPWVALIFATIKAAALQITLQRMPLFKPLLPFLVSPRIIKQSIDHQKVTAEKLASRLAQGERPDFFQAMISHKGGLTMTDVELQSNCELIIIAGSETVATALSGASYLLTANPRTLQKLVDEVRSSFAHEDEIDMVSTGQLPYLHAVIEEALRVYPPAPNALAREAPEGGTFILGEHVPAGTILSCQHYSAYHSEVNFKHPDSFIPERFMGDAEFASDRREVLQPFNYGPRNCIGMNLAYAEMRMIMARIIWNFDLTLAEESRNWFQVNVKGRGFIGWERPPIYIHLKPRDMGSRSSDN